MATEIQNPPEQSLASLLQGITNDLGDLIKHHLQFAQAEMKSDLRKSADAGCYLACGVGTSFLGAGLLSLMMVYLLHWLTPPPGSDPAGLRLWASFAIVGVVITGIGFGLTFVGWKKFQSFNPLPDKTADAVKENLQWLTTSK